MSQAGIISITSSPSVPTSFVTDSGTATPVGNVLNVLTGATDGIETSGAGNTVTISMRNRVYGTGVTINGASTDVITLPLGATPGVYTFDLSIAGFDGSIPIGVGYTLVGSVRTTGAAAVLIPGQSLDEFEEAGTDPATAVITVAGNNAKVTVTGAAGFTFNWKVVGFYIFVS